MTQLCLANSRAYRLVIYPAVILFRLKNYIIYIYQIKKCVLGIPIMTRFYNVCIVMPY